MKTKTINIIALTIITFALSGCIVTKEQRIMLDDIEVLKADNKAQKKKIADLESVLFKGEGDTNTLDELNTTLREKLADSEETMAEIRDEFSYLKGFFEDKIHDLEVLNEVTAGLEQTVGKFQDRTDVTATELTAFKILVNEEITTLSSTLADIKKEITILKAAKSEVKKDKKSVKDSDKKTVKTSDSEYLKGYNAVMAKKYTEGRLTLAEFIKKNPTHELADNAQYWIGESYYGQGDWERSVLEFNKVVKNYPKSDKVPGSLLKLAYSFEKLKASKEAQIVYKKIIKEHPKSKEAAEAKTKIKK